MHLLPNLGICNDVEAESLTFGNGAQSGRLLAIPLHPALIQAHTQNVTLHSKCEIAILIFLLPPLL